MKAKIMIDSTSSMPRDYLDKNNVSVLETMIAINGEYKRELSEVDITDFINRITELTPVPTTSFCTPQHALDELEKAYNSGYDTILYPFMTEQTSSQVKSVRLAMKRMKGKINVHLYPTQLAGPSQAPFAIYGVKMLNEGKKIEEIISFYDKLKPNITTVGVAENFDMLFRTGKIKRDVKMAVVTTILNLKPLFEVPVDKGVIGFDGGKGMKDAIKKIEKKIKNDTKSELSYNMIITHSDAIPLAKKIEKRVRKIRDIVNVNYWLLPPVIINTVGKGSVMVTLYPTYDSIN